MMSVPLGPVNVLVMTNYKRPLPELCKYPTPATGREYCHNRTGGDLCYVHIEGLTLGELRKAHRMSRKTTPAIDAAWRKRFRNELRRTARLWVSQSYRGGNEVSRPSDGC